LTCASPPASTLAHRVSPLPEPPPLAPTPTTTPQCDCPPRSTAAGAGPGSVTGSAATGGSTAAGAATGAAALPTGGKAFADAPALPLTITSEFPMSEFCELLMASCVMCTLEL